jgi:hypothetical protein
MPPIERRPVESRSPWTRLVTATPTWVDIHYAVGNGLAGGLLDLFAEGVVT